MVSLFDWEILETEDAVANYIENSAKGLFGQSYMWLTLDGGASLREVVEGLKDGEREWNNRTAS